MAVTAASPHRPLLGFDFGGTKIAVALASSSPSGVGGEPEVLARTTLPTNAGAGPSQALERAFEAARSLLEGRQPAAVGVSTMGYTYEDRVEFAPNVPGWAELRLPELFGKAFPGVPCEIENDVRAAAVAEFRWGALAGADPAVFVNFGTGIAASVLLGGRLLEGHHGVAGEIGYCRVPPSPGAGDAPVERPESWPSLEETAGGGGVLGRTGRSFSELLADGAPESATEVERVVRLVSLSVLELAAVIDPERIAVGGGYAQAGERVLGPIRSLLATLPWPHELVVGRFGGDAGLYGALALALGALESI